MIGSSRVLAILLLTGSTALADESALRLRAVPVAGVDNAAALSVELVRWSTDAERSPLLAALAPTPPPPPAATSSEPAAAGRGGGRAAGRGGRGGRGGGGAPPPSPIERLSGAVKAAPTVGYIWAGITGYSIKYAWRAPAADGGQRVVLVTDRRLDATATSPTPGSPAGEFTVIEMLLDPKGVGEAKTSLTTTVAIDAAAQTLALDGYRAAPALLKVTR